MTNAEEKDLPPPDTEPAASLSLDALVDEHFDYLYRYAFRYFRSQERAEDLVQETFLAATEAIKRYQGNSTPRTWLTGILRHKILDLLRRKDKEECTDFEALENDPLLKLFNEQEHWRNETGPLVWGNNPDAVLKQKQFFLAVENCLGKLPTKFRQIFLLRELEGYEREDICAQFELTSTNVGVILHRARLSLQQCLQKSWFLGAKPQGAV